MPFWAQKYSQDAGSITIIWLLAFHEHAILIILIIFSIVSYAIMTLLLSNKIYRYVVEAQIIEIVWTILPAFTLLLLAFPSLHILYILEELIDPDITFKVIAHQWYWTYEYSDTESVNFDSYILIEDELKTGEFRLLEVDHRIVIPVTIEIRTLVTSADVIHSWAIPSLGIKIDAIPGRLNQLGYTVARTGVFYGQCSEICGANHSFIPIVLEAVSPDTFYQWAAINKA